MATKKAAPKKKAAAKKAAPKKAPPKKPSVRPLPTKTVKKTKRAVTVNLDPEKLQKAAGIEVQIPEPDKRTREFLRYVAGLQYTTSLNGISVRELCETGMFSSVPTQTMTKWAMADKWSDRRREILESWREQVEQRIGSKLVQQKMKLVEQFQDIQDTLLEKLLPKSHKYVEALEPIVMGNTVVEVCEVCGRTALQHLDPFLGVAGDKLVDVLLKLVKMREEMSEAILLVTTRPGYGLGNALGPQAGKNSTTGFEKPQLSQEEARAAAKAIILERQKDAP